MAVRMTLKDFLDPVEGVYKSVDLRVVAVRTDDTWQNALTVVRFSCKEVEELEEQQKELEARWDRVKTENFKIELQAILFVTLQFLCEQFNEGRWFFFGGDDVQFGRSIDLLSLEGEFRGVRYTKEDIPGWPCFEAQDGQHCALLGERNLQREVKAETGIDVYELISELLEIRFSPHLGFDLVVDAPFYSLVEYVDFAAQRCEARVRFHKDVSDLAVSVFARQRGSSGSLVAPPQRIPVSASEAQELDEDFRLWTGFAELPDAMRYDYLFVELMQTKPTGLDIDSHFKPISQYLEAKKPESNPLLSAFRPFCRDEEFEKQLTRPQEAKEPQRAFEEAVSWLLALCGFRTIKLAGTQHEILREAAKVTRFSVDTLAYMDQEPVLLVECTIGDPLNDIDKLNSLRWTVLDQAFKRTNVQVRPVIFSAAPRVDTAKEMGKGAGVKVLGGDDIRNILACIKQDDVGAVFRLLLD